MLFKTTYKHNVVEIRDSGAVIQHYLKGKKRDVQRDVQTFKKNSKAYMIVDKNSLIVWM